MHPTDEFWKYLASEEPTHREDGLYHQRSYSGLSNYRRTIVCNGNGVVGWERYTLVIYEARAFPVGYGRTVKIDFYNTATV